MNLALREKTRCTEEEKQSCLATVAKIIEYANMARSHGMLVLEEESKNEENPLLVKGIALIVCGTASDTVKRILENSIVFSDCEGAELLKNLIVYEGITLIHEGINPSLIETSLLAYLGFSGEEMYAKYKEQNNSVEENILLKYYEELTTITPSADENKQLISRLITPPYCYQLLLKLNPDDLARAMCCWDKNTQHQILAYLPYSRAKQMVAEINRLPKEHRHKIAVSAQETLTGSIEELASRGEIFLPDVLPKDSSRSSVYIFTIRECQRFRVNGMNLQCNG